MNPYVRFPVAAVSASLLLLAGCGPSPEPAATVGIPGHLPAAVQRTGDPVRG